jgi:hypothetical protein
MRAGQEVRDADRKLMMSRPAALSALAFSATAMMADGLARPIRWAKCGILQFSYGLSKGLYNTM